MSYLKGLTGRDVIVSPLTLHHQFTLKTPVGSSTDDSTITVFDGVNTPYVNGIGTGSAPLVYNSIKQLYFSNFISASNKGYGIDVPQITHNSDGTLSGPVISPIGQNNFPQSINEKRFFSTSSNATIKVISIPRNMFGDYIQPGSFATTSPVRSDDGEGNIIVKSTGQQIGNILYGAGLIVITGSSADPGNLTFRSSYTVFETQFKCTVEASELNYSLNPSLLKSSIRGQNKIKTTGSADYEDFVTGSVFTPFVTTVGLYNDDKELMAVGKLSQPLALSQHVDTTILVNIDR